MDHRPLLQHRCRAGCYGADNSNLAAPPMEHVRFTLLSLAVAFALFVGMMISLELGRRLGLRDLTKLGKDGRAGVGVVEGAVYGLLALLVGFTFSGAATRYEGRRVMVAQVANALGTAWMRTELLPVELQQPVRAEFRNYLDALLASYDKPPGSPAELRLHAASNAAEKKLWATAVAACLTPAGDKARMLLLPEMNEGFDLVEMERFARRLHAPAVVFVMLGVAALASALFAGYGTAGGPARNWMYFMGVAATIAIAAYVILELESPRLGLLRAHKIDEVLVELRASWDEPVQATH